MATTPEVFGSKKRFAKISLMKPLSKIIVHYKNADKFKTAFLALANFVIGNQWAGACHATSAILYAVAKRLSIEATPCIGEAFEGTGTFDHSWIEIDGKPYDVAIAVPLKPECACAPVFAGIDICAMKPTIVEYGIFHRGLESPADSINYMDLFEYLQICPDINLLELTKELCSMVGCPANDEWLKMNLRRVKRKYVVINVGKIPNNND